MSEYSNCTNVITKDRIAAYCRISVDDERSRENTSIENQKAIIQQYSHSTFPECIPTFYIDRDKSGYTFEQREAYQTLRKELFDHQYDVLIVKDLSRFSRRNGAGLVELEALRDEGIRIISIGDNIDYPTSDDWLRIQIYFLMNEIPVTDTSKKVRNVIKQRQMDGKWICSVPYGYVMKNSKAMIYEVDYSEAAIIQKVFNLYLSGWGYKRIANYLTDLCIPTPRMDQRARIESRKEKCNLKVKSTWSIATIQGILTNDFYIGTLRQGKYSRNRINGIDIKTDEESHIVFTNHHEPIIDTYSFELAQKIMRKRSKSSYRGTKKHPNIYSGLLFCGDCGSPMFSMSRSDDKEAYRCGEYHKRGRKGCTSHHIRVAELDFLVKRYVQKMRDSSTASINQIQQIIRIKQSAKSPEEISPIEQIRLLIQDSKTEKKALIRQCTKDIIRRPDHEQDLQETYDELIFECDNRIKGLENQIAIIEGKKEEYKNTKSQDVFVFLNDIQKKDKLTRNDLDILLIEKIFVYDDYISIVSKDNNTFCYDRDTK
jgi:DNA invertase Pin-like site-specific DNA recombinase